MAGTAQKTRDRGAAAPLGATSGSATDRCPARAESANEFLAGREDDRDALHLAETFHKNPALVAQYTRCGKATCRCNGGRPHGPYAVLRWREGGRQRRRYVKRADVERVRAVVGRRRSERAVLRAEFAESASLLRALNALHRELDRGGPR
jgi:hypothetical protein